MFAGNTTDALFHFVGTKAVGGSVREALNYYFNNLMGSHRELRQPAQTQTFGSRFDINVGTALVVPLSPCFVSAMAGYGFAMFGFTGKNVLTTVLFSSLSISFGVILVPLLILLVEPGLWVPCFARP